ncbi:hypothetical protein GLOTRDRAFT_134921 [Gloeophyllum trabeum ATCC 11539]|uniref:C2H2-type domain-containing protein n=1 Tax=Gloeophyllum trabeum (strain ATCC 11539 / FP-39264 / Madison 617) TaxID=670483 RepID=S7RYZ6_GLOTA|nr:uncharacterized protein GLOTRDRAFT_134921 [Gloeophyllum trabeum ATCC 11539]EPQ60195.1 hypothetical protein GLOTRDRAFT_134921 [Gloeophyllum trabeum ATCC 11539]
MEAAEDKNTPKQTEIDAPLRDPHSEATQAEGRPGSSESAVNTNRRRVTRSQTARLPASSQGTDNRPAKKRKAKDDPPPPSPEASTSSAPFPLDPQLSEEFNQPASVPIEAQPEASPPTLQRSTSANYTFLEQPTFPDPPFQSERRGPRTRIAPPVPVPNLTKRSRGRRVPVGAAAPERDRSQNGRMYICKVQDCGKRFNRGEHLKRHVRSIHTHDKPFQCTYPSCEKFFSRHDNLLQHQKIHRDYNFSQDPDPLGGTLHRVRQSPRVDDIPMVSSMSVILPHPIATITTFPPSAEPIGFSAHMAVSSLRTELPAAPDDTQGHMHTMQTEAHFAHIFPAHFEPQPPPPPPHADSNAPVLDFQS